jgi:copper(I)-binding protein
VEFRAGPDASAPPLASIAITAGPDMAFKASGYHLLLKGLKAPLEWGRNYSMGLKFERAGVINVLVSVGAH